MQMGVREAEQVLLGTKPEPEDTVDLCCPDCSGFWSSRFKGLYALGDEKETVYKNYVGDENCALLDTGFVYFCPNGCGTYLSDVHEVGVLTPHMRWWYAEAVVKKHQLERQLQEVEQEIQSFENLY